MTEKSPAFQWYPKDILSSARVAEMTLEEEGAYRRALDYCWLNGSLPADEEKLARVIGKGASQMVARVVKEMFVLDALDGTRLVHERLEIERQKQGVWREKSRKGGLASAGKRKKTKVLPPEQCGSNLVETKRQPKGQPKSNSSSPSSSYLKETLTTNVVNAKKSGTRIPDPFLLTPEMRSWAKENHPLIDLDLETAKFCDYWRAKTRDNTKLDWVATWRNWIRSARHDTQRTSQNGTHSNHQPTAMDRLREHAEIISRYPTEAELAAQGDG